ncbi:MAG TPA: MmcB family DNA repair protein [Stellaceae bacterium]|nr:MmcB family DNA repair protein [Stellaceae bacterium]
MSSLDAHQIPKELARGVCRALAHLGFATLTEVPLVSRRRVDVMGLGRDGTVVIIEIKSSVADFRADHKWPEYQGFCDRLYFALPPGFPQEIMPSKPGLILADAFGATILREAPHEALLPARRKAVTLRFARIAARRLQRLLDPLSEG